MTTLAWDFETERFGPSNLAPEPICVSVADDEGNSLVIAACEPEFDDILEHCLRADLQVNMNIAFDMSVILAHRPKLAPLVWAAYREDRVTDLAVREKLLVLAHTGDLEYAVTDNGAKIKLGWSQADLEKKHLGIDRTADKTDDDAWRSNYSALKGIPASEYPKDAFDYSMADAVNALAIFKRQKGGKRVDPEFLNARAALALQLSSCWGIAVDREMVEKLFAELSERFHERHFPHLLQAGMLTPSVPALPYVRQMTRAIALVGGVEPLDWEPHREALNAAGISMKDRVESKKNDSAIRQRVKEVSEKFQIPLHYTEPSERHPEGQISYNAEALADLHGLDPALDELIDRTEIQKLVTTELPRMRAGRVHPRYDVIKKTGRTSSYGNSKKDKNPPYPAVNIQQIDPRVREAYIASPGNVLCSVDYNYIELVSVAQKCLALFGKSILAEKINAGYDPHAYLGAAIARAFSQGEFVGHPDGDENYRMFLPLKKSDRGVWDLWRGLAKPTGLGFPGGLGAERFIGYAKSTFGVDIIKIAGGMEAAVALVRQLKNLWLDTYPEMREYFGWITRECRDVEWSSPGDDRYCYSSPHGMVRRNCYYTEATNGAALQTPTAEGAKISLWALAEACFDASVGSCLLGCHPVAFIHDEVIVEMPHDALMHERAFEVARIMIEGMSKVMTQVKVGAAPACMFRWNKKAEAVFDPSGRLQVWTPPTQEKTA